MSEIDFKIINVETICRVCCINELCLKSIFEERVANMELKDILMSCANVEIIPDDGLPHQICDDCLNQVIVAFDFKEKCEKSDLKLRETMLQNLQTTGFYHKAATPELNADDSLDAESVQILENVEECLIISDDDNNDESFLQLDDMQGHEEQNQLRELLRMGEMSENWRCDLCPTVLRNSMELANHKQLAHSKSIEPAMKTSNLITEIHKAELINPYEKCLALCKICDAWFTKIRQLRVHLMKHMDVTTLSLAKLRNKLYLFDLTKISPTEADNATLADHIALDLRNNIFHRFYQIRDPTGYELELSDSDSQDDSAHHSCFKCGEAFNRAYKLNRHIRQRHRCELPHECYTCHRKYPTEYQLARHIKRQCANTSKQYICKRCNIRFMWQNSYHIHNYVCHAIDKKEFQCEVCKKSFTQKRHMERHARTHFPEEKKYECRACNKKFHRSDYLRYHMKKHHDTEPEEIDRIIWEVSRRGNYCRTMVRKRVH